MVFEERIREISVDIIFIRSIKVFVHVIRYMYTMIYYLRISVGYRIIATYGVWCSITCFKGKIKTEKVQHSLASVQDRGKSARKRVARHNTARWRGGRRWDGGRWTSWVRCYVDRFVITVSLGKITPWLKKD